MGIINRSVEHLKNYIREEISLRCLNHNDEFVQAVIRSGAMIGSRVDGFDSLPRGMDQARKLIAEYEKQGESFPSGLTIVANELTGGKGRFRRYWHAPKGGLWLTLVLVNTFLPESSRLIPLAAGIACCEAVQQHVPAARLKWVNDVHLAGRKIAGILSETTIGPCSGEEYVLVGIGINVNNESFPPELAGLAQSIRTTTGVKIDLDQFRGLLLAKLVWNIGLLAFHESHQLREHGFIDDHDEHPVIAAWRGLSDSIGRRVLFGHNVQEAPQYEAVVRAIQPDGALRLGLGPGKGEIVENSGELLYLD